MAITSSVVGAGIISVPYSMIVNGIWVGIAIHVIDIIMMVVCVYLYVTARDMYQIDNLSDLCFMTFGRASVYIMNAMIAFVVLGIMILYMILFSRICISLFADSKSSILAQKWFWVLLLIILSLPVLIKRKITAMKWNSRLLFIGIMTLLATFFFKAVDNKNFPAKDFEWDLENVVNSINVTITTYGFILNLFPIT